jgi:hypothetical protein
VNFLGLEQEIAIEDGERYRLGPYGIAVIDRVI